MAKTLARILNVPFAIGRRDDADRGRLRRRGRREHPAASASRAADYDLEAAQRGIIYIDEIDKIGKTSGNVSHHA